MMKRMMHLERVVLACAAVLASATVLAQPTITQTPTNQYVSLGADVRFQVRASGAPPLTYQWWKDSATLDGATNSSLNLTNVQVLDSGLYKVTVADPNGATDSVPAMLYVDASFTKITRDPIVTENAHWHGATWGDYNNDGYADLFIHQTAPVTKDILYRNNGDGTFTKLTEPNIRTYSDPQAGWCSAWADYDNDGNLDLFIPDVTGRNVLQHNRGDGTFERILTGPGGEGTMSTSAAWGDYDGDGYLDLFVVNSQAGLNPGINWLYHNQGNGTFTRMTTNQVGPVVQGSALWFSASWMDFDEDGWLDLFAPIWGSTARLYHNLANGRFDRLVNNALVSTSMPTLTHAWADYDNDGRLDLLVGMDDAHPMVLFHNEGDGVFRRMTADEVGPISSDKTAFGGIAWGDYDNDGFLDVLVAGGWGEGTSTYLQTKSLLYHNNGDGTFSRVIFGSPVNDVGEWMGAYSVDYDRDGFLDLFVYNHGVRAPAQNCLYRNNGNSNNWLCVNCVGTVSPRDGTGAKVRALATIRGNPTWQLRLINVGGTCWGGLSFVAHFGLGDATNVDLLRIEWPSGTVQELRNIPPKQYLTVREPVQLQMAQPGVLQARSWKNMAFEVQSSSDLLAWTTRVSVTNLSLTGGIQWTDPDGPSPRARFYRALAR